MAWVRLPVDVYIFLGSSVSAIVYSEFRGHFIPVITLPATLFEAWGVHRAQGQSYLLYDHQSSMMTMKGIYQCDKRGSNGDD